MRKGNFILKRAVSSVLSVAMVCASIPMGTVMPTVFAAEETEIETSVSTGSSLTVEKAVVGHTYKVYQIFTGDVDADGKTLSNVRYGKNYGDEGKKVPEDLLERLENLTDAKTFAKEITSENAGGGIVYPAKRQRSLQLTTLQ